MEKVSYIDPELMEDLVRFSFHNKGIPPYMQKGVFEYITEGVAPGGFLTAVICKDITGMMQSADNTNMWLFPVYYAFFYNCAPEACWGSKEKMDKWLSHNGMRGYNDSRRADEDT